ncbi:MAG: RNA-protein complex protein Nop10 [Candidatus Methanoplasma sp.]|nr:RNA-protein complex protein Nop10 [Candidatus Methanoplasma sp.]
MKSFLRKCTACGRYTLGDICPACGSVSVNPVPAKFSPEDRYGGYRRKSVEEEYGENGKYHHL